MKEVTVKYGDSYLSLSVPQSTHIDMFEPKAVTPLADVAKELANSLEAPLGCLPCERPPRSVAIAVPDETRPVPLKSILPALVNRLLAAWKNLQPEDITIVVGGGLHPPADVGQLERILPKEIHGCLVVAHDAKRSPVTNFGKTSRGTPVEINSAFANAEFKIVVGMVDCHQFVGFTGGAKGVAVGCASATMIAANHKLMSSPCAFAGNVDDNPVRKDLDESGKLIGVHLAINVVMSPSKEAVAIFAGEPEQTMRKAAEKTGKLYGFQYDKPYDVVIASCGGTPKDICLYQAQKGLAAAAACVAPKGKILLLAECSQGIGDDVYYNYVRKFSSDGELLQDFVSAPFKMGAHKAFLFARVTNKHEVILHSALAPALVRECLLQPGNANQTLERWLKEMPQARVAVLPSANSSFFKK